MFNLCLENLYSVIVDGLRDVQNENFRIRFKSKFSEKYFKDKQIDLFKEIRNSDSIFHQIVDFNTRIYGSSLLVHDLIEVICQQIEMNPDELKQDMFYNPTKTSLTYVILFENPFIILPIHRQIIEKLLLIIIEWEKDGFFYEDVICWNELNVEQRDIACQIWNSVNRNNLRELMKNENQISEKIISIIDNVTVCLMNYCTNTRDKDVYFTHIQNIQQQLNEVKLKSIKIPSPISEILVTAQRLNPIYKSFNWQKFLNENGLTHKTNLHPNSEDTVIIHLSRENMSCNMTLEIVQDIFQKFITRLSNLSNNQTKPCQTELEELFPKTIDIDQEFEILKSALPSDAISYLSILLVYWKNRETINHICNGFIYLFNRYQISDADGLNILNDFLSIDQFTSSETCIRTYQAYYHYYAEVYSTEILDFMCQCGQSTDFLTFLYDLNKDDVENLMEIVNDWEETLFNARIIIDFVLLKNFFLQVDKLIVLKQSTLHDIIQPIEQIWIKDEFRNIRKIFETCSISFETIQYIHRDLTDRERSKRDRILDIVDSAQFKFVQLENRTNLFDHDFDIEIIDRSSKSKSVHFNELSELRDRARLLGYVQQNNIKPNVEQLKRMVSFVETIHSILNTLTSLYRAGCPSFEQIVSLDRQFSCSQGNYDELEQVRIDLEKELTQWNEELCRMYKQCVDLTYFSMQQIWIVEDFLYKQEKEHLGYHLLKFIGIDPENIDSESLPARKQDTYDRLNNIATILNTYHPRSKSILTRKQIFAVHTSNEGTLRAIFSLFNHINIPIKANQLFFCTPTIHWIEIKAFIYRCFYSQIFHQLIHPELLSLTIQDQFVQCFNQLIDKSPKHLFTLGIITTISPLNLHLINGLKTHCKMVQTLSDQDLLYENELNTRIQQCIQDKCILVTSEIAGLGKSTFIQNESERLGKIYVKFPIAGNVNIDTLAERLRDQRIQSNSSNIVLHVDIGPVDNIQQLNEFLYCLILFRCFRLRQIPVDVSTEILIYLELDSSAYLKSMQDQIVICQYLKVKQIDRVNWDDLKTDQTKIQFVANYIAAIRNQSINKINLVETQLPVLEHSTCISLIKPYVIETRNENLISWIDISIFLSIYYKLFSGFSRSGYFKSIFTGNASTFRIDVLEPLLKSCKQFMSFNIGKIRQNRSSDTEYHQAIIRWEESQPFTLIFTDNDYPVFIYKTPGDVPQSVTEALRHYFRIISQSHANLNKSQRTVLSLFSKRSANNTTQLVTPNKNPDQRLKEFLLDPRQMTHEQFFFKLTQLSTKYFALKSTCEICFRQYEYDVKQCEHCSIENTLLVPLSSSSQHIEEFQKQIAEKIRLEYIFTADNYVKMLLVYLRVQSNLPVLIMGETGCGKTALIQCLCQKILDDEMEVFHVHAGITNEKIIEKMNEFIVKAGKCLENDNRKRLWIFFDEFNTTSSIGLLKEIICERTLLGEPLPSNMVFLGACNPKRPKSRKQTIVDSEKIPKFYSIRKRRMNGNEELLSYSVVSIPETMLEYVWDFGILDENTEKTYIQTMLKEYRLNERDDCWFDCMVELINESHKYFRTEDVSSVSLRDVARYRRFYKWLWDHLCEIRTERSVLIENLNFRFRVSLLSLFLCYYFRLNTSDKRKEYLKRIEKTLKDSVSELNCELFMKLLHKEKMALMNLMEIPSGIAINNALSENIYVLFMSIFNRIPVILCGKPGSSKTLAVQIVISNLRGKKSSKLFFQNLPELIAISYQGSHNCTSKSIIKVFNQAEKYNSIGFLPVIVFDEIGLAEFSPHNPLKVLHSHLEIETCRYGFVGLSNWQLDASKMNRAVYIVCPKPDLVELTQTAVSISESILSNNAQIFKLDINIIKSLANAYVQMYKHLKNHGNEHFFGLRDYYTLIKGIANDLVQKKDPYETIHYHLSCNFDGVFNGSTFMWSEVCKYLGQEHRIGQYSPPTFDQLLNHCISSRTGRFLMLIGDNESTFDDVQRYITIKHPSLRTKTLIGSTFEGDLLPNGIYTEQYNNRVLMDIILYAEKDIALFLRGLGHLYDNLYDLFNQNYAVSTKKKYCRIALSSLYHPRCFVNDEFYCIVFVKREDLEKYDEPFLNRFEKHLIELECLTTKSHGILVSRLKTWMNELLSMSMKDFFVWSKSEYLHSLVTEAFDYFERSNSIIDNEQVLKYCQNQILRISSFDLPLCLSYGGEQDRSEIIEQYYKNHTDFSFVRFIEKETNDKLLVYTYTQIYESIDYLKISIRIEETKLNYFKTELELVQKLNQHYNLSDSASLLCIRIDYQRDHSYIPILKQILINEYTNTFNRRVCLIIHLQRCKVKKTTNDVFFGGWSSIMIDNLQTDHLLPRPILLQPSYTNLLTCFDIFKDETIFDELINRCIVQCHYTVSNRNDELKINYRRNEILQTLQTPNTNDTSSLRFLFKKHLLELANSILPMNFNDWRQDLFADQIITNSCRSVHDALHKILFNFLDRHYSLLLAHYEKHSLIDSYLFILRSNETIRKKLWPIWLDCSTTVNKLLIDSNSTNISLVFDLHLPCATIEYEHIRQIRQTFAQNLDEISIESLYQELIHQSIYGEFIEKIFNDPILFEYYYQDQLTLERNQNHIHHLSSSFIHKFLTWNLTLTPRDQLVHLLIDYEQLFEIMRIFEMVLPLFIDENYLFELLIQPFTSTISTNLYRLVIQNSTSYLIPPGSSTTHPNYLFQCQNRNHLFIHISLMNLLELLLSPIVLEHLSNIKQLLMIYNFISRSMMTFDQYNMENLEKFNSFIHLAYSISKLYPQEHIAFNILKQIYDQPTFCASLQTPEHIREYINSLKENLPEQNSNEQILAKLENEFLRNWSIENDDQCDTILQFIHDYHLWQYSAKYLYIIDRDPEFSFSEIVQKNYGLIDIDSNDDYKTINRFLNEISTDEIEILLIHRIYIQLIFNTNNLSTIQFLQQNFKSFEQNLNTFNQFQPNDKFKRICSIAWLRYYLFHYITAIKNENKENIIENIYEKLMTNNSSICSTVNLYLIKQLCHTYHLTFYEFRKKDEHRTRPWKILLGDQSSKRYSYFPLVIFNNQQSSERITTYRSLLGFIRDYTDVKLQNILREESVSLDIDKRLSSLCTKVVDQSYFQLNTSMSDEDLHHRLIILTIIALIISFNSNSNSTDIFLNRTVDIENGIDSIEKIVRCSNDCSWLFCGGDEFTNSCPLCGRYVEMNQSRIAMNKKETLAFLEQVEDSKPVSYHLSKLIVYANRLLNNEDLSKDENFKNRIEIILKSIRKCLLNIDEWYIWLYQLFNSMIEKNLFIENTNQFEELINDHLDSIVQRIRTYKLEYIDLTYGDQKNSHVIHFVDELIEDPTKYPRLQFFNLTTIELIDLIDHFSRQFRFQSDYPLTSFIFKHLSDLQTIQYLYPIVRIMNYLHEQYDYRINRNDAKNKTFGHYLNDNPDLDKIYRQFIHDSPDLSSYLKKDSELSMFLFTKSTLEVNSLRKLSQLQNDLLEYFYGKDKSKYSQRIVSIQSINEKHLFQFDSNQLCLLLINRGLTIDYRYGLSREIIYDYDEIERCLTKEISQLSWIDFENIQYFHFQGEFTDEQKCLINQIRTRFEQDLFEESQRKKIQEELQNINNDTILDLYNLLTYILAFLRNINNKTIFQSMTIETFIKQHIHLKSIVGNPILNKQMISSIPLKSIIDFYELIEECLFDKMEKFKGKPMSNHESSFIVHQVIQMITNIPVEPLNDLNIWIDMFKRLIVRVSLANIQIDYDAPLQDYVKRSDTWKGNLTAENLRMIEINPKICLKHASIIYQGLVTEQENRMNMMSEETIDLNPPSVSSTSNKRTQRNRNKKR